MPGEFIPLAEETGLIVPIGEWALYSACKQNKEWQKKGFPVIPISVNVSGLQFQSESFIHSVTSALKYTGLSPDCLEIEITESILHEIGKIGENVNKLRRLGVKISIDDFGTGYSSISLLKSLTVNNLKLDPSFVKDVDTNPKTELLIKSIIDMGHNLGFKIVAEGVEYEYQMRMLQRNGCDLFQGYYFSRPMPAEDIEALWQKSMDTENA
ncbi:MAG TPA: EAL domain-containing protein [Clostridiaceae bacterium]|nr:EAL domain-containing protein [Clostridiaceae bacterium]